MSKKKASAQRRKRDKKYTGEDAAAPSRAGVLRIKAEPKSKIREYWQEKRTFIIAKTVITLAALLLAYLLFVLISWII